MSKDIFIKVAFCGSVAFYGLGSVVGFVSNPYLIGSGIYDILLYSTWFKERIRLQWASLIFKHLVSKFQKRRRFAGINSVICMCDAQSICTKPRAWKHTTLKPQTIHKRVFPPGQLYRQ
jgi:hypothetical protein